MQAAASQASHPGVTPAVREFVSRRRKQLIDGQWVDAASGEHFTTVDPATEAPLAEVPAGDREDVDRAVRAARRALESGPWARMTASERGRAIWKLADLIEQHAEEFAQLETLDNGKPIAVARAADIPLVVDHFRYYAGWATKVEGETIPVSVPGMLCHTVREPVGVVGQIIPWNFP
jgi:acyl-CoA reductase-like NAD-dependent aldehyde dehydrogenase